MKHFIQEVICRLTNLLKFIILIGLTILNSTTITAQSGKKISPDLFGLFFEDINYSADGGLYAEMVQTGRSSTTRLKTGHGTLSLIGIILRQVFHMERSVWRRHRQSVPIIRIIWSLQLSMLAKRPNT